LRRLWKQHRDELEARLAAHRAEPRAEFLAALKGQLQVGPSARRLRLAIAAAVTISALGLFAAFGGVGYGASAAKSFGNSIVSNHSSSNRHDDEKGKGKDKDRDEEDGECDTKTPAGAQYCEDDEENEHHHHHHHHHHRGDNG